MAWYLPRRGCERGLEGCARRRDSLREGWVEGWKGGGLLIAKQNTQKLRNQPIRRFARGGTDETLWRCASATGVKNQEWVFYRLRTTIRVQGSRRNSPLANASLADRRKLRGGEEGGTELFSLETKSPVFCAGGSLGNSISWSLSPCLLSAAEKKSFWGTRKSRLGENPANLWGIERKPSTWGICFETNQQKEEEKMGGPKGGSGWSV